ncbi:cytochrome P450 [Palleronia caenipelagi]|uniref:Cytochrome P450 n=1 Tax=Palleronia caenipelagi TaxID=2489174 RepID=A0A547Q658_9RHOB|nr:cytochrome P450 [Palleronia caenipelagi]TRD21867.1 cytochrome P450 [Palleronia caenipelagi]
MSLPVSPQGDLTVALARDPYRTLSQTALRVGADAFRGKLLLSDTVFLTGRDMAEQFYTGGFATVSPTGSGKILGFIGGNDTDAETQQTERQRRRALLTDAIAPEKREALIGRVEAGLKALSERAPNEIVLRDEMVRVLTRATLEWAGLTLSEGEAEKVAEDLITRSGHAIPTSLRKVGAAPSQQRLESWAATLIGEIRANTREVTRDGLADQVASYYTAEMLPPDRKEAGTEFLNHLNAITGVATYFTFMAHACATRENGHRDMSERPHSFVQEVRRYYPAVPFVRARTSKDVEIAGATVEAGTRVVLDLYGINHDARLWDHPAMFRPSRFDNLTIDPYALLAQGAGDEVTGNPCPGLDLTTDLMLAFGEWFSGLTYEMPRQNLDLAMSEMPALPKSGVVLQNLRAA